MSDSTPWELFKELEEECLAAAISLVEGHTPRMIEAVVFSEDDPDEDLEVWAREALFLLVRAGRTMIDAGKWPLLAAVAAGPRFDSPEFDKGLREMVEEEG